MKSLLSAVVFSCILTSPFHADAETESSTRTKDHEALRTLMKETVAAMNSRDMGKLSELIDHPTFTLIDVTNRKFTSFKDYKAEVMRLTEGSGSIFSKYEISAEAEGLTEFVAPHVGVVHGRSNDTFHLKTGDTRQMSTRWTVVVRKIDQSWKISKVHFSVNLLDNPVLKAAQTAVTNVTPLAGGVGFLAGAFLVLILRRKKES